MRPRAPGARAGKRRGPGAAAPARGGRQPGKGTQAKAHGQDSLLNSIELARTVVRHVAREFARHVPSSHVIRLSSPGQTSPRCFVLTCRRRVAPLRSTGSRSLDGGASARPRRRPSALRGRRRPPFDCARGAPRRGPRSPRGVRDGVPARGASRPAAPFRLDGAAKLHRPAVPGSRARCGHRARAGRRVHRPDEARLLRQVRLGGIAVAARRGAVIAAALATGATAVLVEHPGPRPARRCRAHVRADRRSCLSDCRMVLFAARVSLDSPIALAADEAIVIDGSGCVAAGRARRDRGRRGGLRAAGDRRRARLRGAVTAEGARLLGPADEPARACMTIELERAAHARRVPDRGGIERAPR